MHSCSWITALEETLRGSDGLDIHILTISPRVTRMQKVVDGAVTYHFVPRRSNYYWRNFATSYRHERRLLRDVIRQVEPDVIHVFGTEDLYPVVALESGVPSIVHMQGILTLYNQARGLRFDTTWLGWTCQSVFERNSIARHRHFFVRTRFDSSFVRYHNRDAHLVYCWEPLRNEFYSPVVHKSEKRYVLFMGGTDPFKGFDLALKIFEGILAKIPDLELIIMGYPDPAGEGERIVRLYGQTTLDRIRRVGFLPPQEIRRYLRDALVLLSCSRSENSPNSVCEAQISGVPVVAMNVGGIPDLIQDDHDGFLIRHGDVEAAVARVWHLWSDPPDFERISANAIETASRRHDRFLIRRCVIDTYREMLESHLSVAKQGRGPL